ncbi:hypothetical protein M432DRAFT_590372 [Thermoascus aurantiacus ATCC 26904]
MHVVEDKITRTPKGFGYVEFAAVDRPKKALMYSGATLQGRSIRGPQQLDLQGPFPLSEERIYGNAWAHAFSIKDDSIKGSLTGKTICLKDCIAVAQIRCRCFRLT